MNVKTTYTIVLSSVSTCLGPISAPVQLDLHLRKMEQVAVVLQLSYMYIQCVCEESYALIKYLHTDVNECNDVNGGCHHSCTNTFGSYICSCDPGYLLLEDNSTCEGSCNAITVSYSSSVSVD